MRMIYQFERTRIERCDECDFFYSDVDGMSYEYGYCTRHEDIIDGHKTSQDNDCPMVAIPKAETGGCEWCKDGLDFEVVWHSFGSSFVDVAHFCPNCGRRLEETI